MRFHDGWAKTKPGSQLTQKLKCKRMGQLKFRMGNMALQSFQESRESEGKNIGIIKQKISQRELTQKDFSLFDLLISDFSSGPDRFNVDGINFIRVESDHGRAQYFSKVNIQSLLEKVVAHFFDAVEANISGRWGERSVHFPDELLSRHPYFVRFDYFIQVQVRFRKLVTQLLEVYFQRVGAQISVRCLLPLFKFHVFFLFLLLMKAYLYDLDFFLFPF